MVFQGLLAEVGVVLAPGEFITTKINEKAIESKERETLRFTEALFADETTLYC